MDGGRTGSRVSRAGPWLILGLFAVGAAVRALRFGGRFVTPYHWDEASLAVQALDILGGGLPVHFLGVEYMGATPAYPLAAWFALAGASPLALDLFAYAEGLAVFGTGYLVARRLLAPWPARLALAVLAVPPLLLVKRSLGTLDYPLLLVLGHLILLATHTVVRRPPGPPVTLLVLGGLAGIGLWANLLVVVYLVPFGLLALRTGLLWRARMGLVVAGAVVGALPAWLYELGHFPSARFAVTGAGFAGAEPLAVRLHTVAGVFLPTVLGVEAGGTRAAFPLLAGPAILGVAILIRAIWRDRATLAWLVGMRRESAMGGPALLWGVAITNLALVALAPRGTQGLHYLLPLYSVLPCWTGELIAWLWRLRPAVGRLALAALLAFQLRVNWMDTLGTTPPAERRWAPVLGLIEPVVRWLDARGLRRVAWEVDPVRSYEFTYLTGGRIVAAGLWAAVVVRHGHLVDAADRAPVVTMQGSQAAESLPGSLRAVGMAVRETALGPFRVIEATPTFAHGFAPLRPEGWRVTASPNADEAAALLDRDVATGWDTREPQAPGQWVAVDLGRQQEVARVDLLAVDWGDVPAGLRVEVSRDGATWRTVAAAEPYWGPLFWSEQRVLLKVRAGRVQAIFAPVRARHLRITQTGTVSYRGWSARELFVYAPTPRAPPAPRRGEVAATLRREGVKFVYASHWLSAWVRVDSGWAVGAQEWNSGLNDYGRTKPPPETLVPVRTGPGRAILLGGDADPEAIGEMLAGQPVRVRETMAGPYRLLLFEAAPAPRPLPKAGWRAMANDNPAAARRAIDGRRRSHWVSRAAAGPETALTVDLGAVRRLSRVEVRPGPAAPGGRELSLEASSDGATWQALGPVRWAGALYWTGAELLRNGEPVWAVTFEPTVLRYVRLRPVAAGAGPWIVSEIDCLGQP